MHTPSQLQVKGAPRFSEGFGRINDQPSPAFASPRPVLVKKPARQETAGLIGLLLRVGAMARRMHAGWQRARRARATYRTLCELDTRTLRDLGFDRSEIMSVAAEIAGSADSTRVPRGMPQPGQPM